MFVPKDLLKKSQIKKSKLLSALVSVCNKSIFRVRQSRFLFLPLGPQELRTRLFLVVSDEPLVAISYLSLDLHVPLEWIKSLIDL